MKKIVFVFAFLLTISFQANAQWFPQNSPTTNNLFDVSFISSNIGWVVGGAGTILKTTDGGTSWNPQSSSVTTIIWNAFFVDQNIGTVVCSDGTILRTSDGGDAWISQTSGTSNVLRSIYFIGPDTGWSVGFSGTILKTVNGGITWISQTSGTSSNLYDISFTDVNNGIVVGSDGTILKTTDGGTSWNPQSSSVTTILLGVSFTNINNGTVVGLEGTILKTTDGGTNWVAQSSGTTDIFRDVCFTDVDNGTIVGATLNSMGIILRTTDGGTTWITQVYDSFDYLYSVSFADANIGTTVGRNGMILRTTNGGFTFLPPTLSSVPNGSVNQSINPVFNWYSVPFATNYRFQLSTDSTFQSILIDESNIVDTFIVASNLDYLTKYYWRVNASYPFGTSDWSETWNFTTIISPPEITELDSPPNNSLNQISIFKWYQALRGDIYNLQISTDSLFTNIAFQDSIITDTIKTVTILENNTKYYWKVRAKNIGGYGSFSNIWSFVTVLPPLPLTGINAGNSQIEISWDLNSISNLQAIKIYRDTNPNPANLIATIPSNQNNYSDPGLNNGSTYYYRIKVVSTYGFESDYSNELSATPYNSPPTATPLSDINFPNEGRVLTRDLSFSSSGSSDPDGSIDSVKWYVNDEFISSGTDFIYTFPQGTFIVKLVVVDNQGERDTSTANVSRTMFRKNVNGQVVAGLSLIGSNILYAIVNGDAIYRMDNDGNIDYTLQVGGNLLASSSIANDSTVYIGSTDNNIYAFSKSGTSLWVKALGGAVTTTPTVDILNDRVYVGVSNRNFQFIDRSTGNVLGNYFSDSPINTSAVITSDDRLFFSTSNGTMYGFDLTSISFPNVTPTWIINSSDMISSSPAIDSEGFFYVGTSNGLLKKISMQPGLQGTVAWAANLGGSITASPVIDATGNIYVGSSNNNFYAVDRMNGSIEWSYQFGGQIKTTAAISNDANIYFGTLNGYIYCIDTLGTTLWQYKDSSAICTSLLYSDGVLYLGTLDGRLVALYDQVVTESSTLLANNIWGTFQGNNQRTGEQADRLTSIKEEYTSVPTEYTVFDNFPNPFNPSTIIRYSLPYQSKVKIEVYNIIGEIVKVLADIEQAPGFYDVTFDAAGLSSGIYIYRIVAQSMNNKNQFAQVKKMILLK